MTTPQSPEAQTITLSHPIQVGDERVTTLTLREPTLAVLEDIHIAVRDGEVRLNLGDIPKLVAGLAGIPLSIARKIRVSDLGKIAPVALGFIKPYLPTGG